MYPYFFEDDVDNLYDGFPFEYLRPVLPSYGHPSGKAKALPATTSAATAAPSSTPPTPASPLHMIARTAAMVSAAPTQTTEHSQLRDNIPGGDTDHAKIIIIITCCLLTGLMVVGLIALGWCLHHRKERLRRQKEIESVMNHEPSRDYALIVDFRRESGVGDITSPDYKYPFKAKAQPTANTVAEVDTKCKVPPQARRKSIFNFLRPEGYYEHASNPGDRHVYSELGMAKTAAVCLMPSPNRVERITTVQIDAVRADATPMVEVLHSTSTIPPPPVHYAYLHEALSGAHNSSQEVPVTNKNMDHIYEELPTNIPPTHP